jgi:hypothetical protein
MKLIFGSSPLRGDISGNTEKARKYAKYIIDSGNSPVMPHLFFTQMLDDYLTDERTAGIACGMKWLEKSDEAWFFAKKPEACTEGMLAEYDYAIKLNKPVRFIDPETI